MTSNRIQVLVFALNGFILLIVLLRYGFAAKHVRYGELAC